jgi:hypothetical protein
MGGLLLMRTYRSTLGASFVVALLAGGAVAAEALKSGPQPGDSIPGVFHPLNVTGSAAGKKACQIWMNGSHPVAMIFAREINDGLTSLVKKLDESTDNNSACRMGSFVVFCSDDEGLEKKLKDLADKEKLKHIVLTIDNPAGPEAYKIAKDAEITVVLYTKHEVKVNYTFRKGEMTQRDIDKIVGDVAKILPKKEKK